MGSPGGGCVTILPRTKTSVHCPFAFKNLKSVCFLILVTDRFWSVWELIGSFLAPSGLQCLEIFQWCSLVYLCWVLLAPFICETYIFLLWESFLNNFVDDFLSTYLFSLGDFFYYLHVRLPGLIFYVSFVFHYLYLCLFALVFGIFVINVIFQPLYLICHLCFHVFNFQGMILLFSTCFFILSSSCLNSILFFLHGSSVVSLRILSLGEHYLLPT